MAVVHPGPAPVATMLQRVRATLPRGQTLPQATWERRHRWMLGVLWAHAVALPMLGFILGYPLWHTALHAIPIVACGIAASRQGERRRRSAVVSIGLLTCSALLVHICHGMIEAHFHFFVMLSLLSLYEDWLPFLLAVAYVALHHGIMGTLAPHDVYNHSGNPWALAALHGGFVLAAGVVNLVAWRLNENVRAELNDGYERERMTLDTANDAHFAVDAEGRILSWNRESVRLLGWPAEEAIGRLASETIIPPSRQKNYAQTLELALNSPEGIFGRRMEIRPVDRTGREFPAEATFSAIVTADGWRMNVFLHDISERKVAEAQLHERVEQQAAIADFGRDALDGATVHDIMERAARLLCKSLGGDMAIVLETDPAEQEFILRAMWPLTDAFEPGKRVPAGGTEAYALHAAGKPILIEDWLTETRYTLSDASRVNGLRSGISVVVGGAERPFGALTIQSRTPHAFNESDVSVAQAIANTLGSAIDRLGSDERSRHDALHDALTGLPNRTLFIDRLHHALARNRRLGVTAGVFFIDLDDFKVINDSLGHDAGDALLVMLAPRLATALRVDDTVARFGGDEFVVLCETLNGEEEAILLGRRISVALETAFVIDGNEVFVSASVGVALADGGSDPDGLLRDADAAMYRAKEQGPARVELFDAALRDRAMGRLRLASALRHAIDRGEMHVVYQPIVTIGDGVVTRAEALLRWTHPELGAIGPDEFIPLAESTGLIGPIGRWVLAQACHEGARWHRAGAQISISVNVSARQLALPDFPAVVDAVLTETGLPPERLALEITESVLMEQTDRALAILAAIKALGVGITLDDFGTGYSSLSYLKLLPIDTVKLDRTFIADLGADGAGSSAVIVSAVVSMARALGLTVVAEGVETAGQATLLRDLGCTMAQGWHYGRPVSPERLWPLPVAGRV